MIQCPNCGHPLDPIAIQKLTPHCSKKFSLAKPEHGTIVEILFHCDECSHDWELEMLLPSEAAASLSCKFWG